MILIRAGNFYIAGEYIEKENSINRPPDSCCFNLNVQDEFLIMRRTFFCKLLKQSGRYLTVKSQSIQINSVFQRSLYFVYKKSAFPMINKSPCTYLCKTHSFWCMQIYNFILQEYQNSQVFNT